MVYSSVSNARRRKSTELNTLHQIATFRVLYSYNLKKSAYFAHGLRLCLYMILLLSSTRYAVKCPFVTNYTNEYQRTKNRANSVYRLPKKPCASDFFTH